MNSSASAWVVAWFDELEAAGSIRDCVVLLFTDNYQDPMIQLRFAGIRQYRQLFHLDAWVWWIFY